MINLDLEVRQQSDEQFLQEYLAITLGHVKSLHAAVTAMMTDLAALRRTVLAEPENIGEYQTNLQIAVDTAKPMIDEAMHSYDEMIQVLSTSTSVRWQN
jgi:hypothetical protein